MLLVHSLYLPTTRVALPACLPMFAVVVEYSVRDDLARSYIDPPPPPLDGLSHTHRAAADDDWNCVTVTASLRKHLLHEELTFSASL